MSDPVLTPDELDAVVDACRWITLVNCTPDYFRSFLVERLKDGRPELAAKLGELSPQALHAVCVEVRARQKLPS